MQLTYEQAMGSGLLMHFAARQNSGYMMRSEKRSGAYGSPNRRPPRRKKAGFFYIFFTLLLSILLWPIGMVMLWQRKVRMKAGTKLLVSLLTLCMCVFLIVFALTVPVDNVEYTAFQDKANDWLDKAAADIAVAGDATLKKTAETWQVVTAFAEAGSEYVSVHAADAVDEGVRLAGQAREAIEGLIHRQDAAQPTEATEPPENSAAPAADKTADATPTPGATKAAGATNAPEATKAPKATKTPEATKASEATKTAEAARTAGATKTAEAARTAGAARASGTASASATPEATDGGVTPTATATPKAEKPTRAAGTATASATPDPGDEAIDIHLPEASPDSESAQQLDEGLLHANGEFEPGKVELSPTPDATLASSPLAEATAVLLRPVTALPTEAVTEAPTEAPTEAVTEAPTEAPTKAVTEAPTEAPTETPTEAPTETPTEAPLSYLVKPASEATVYFFDNGSVGFHNGPNRHDMSGAPAHTLQQAFDMGKNPCAACGMPDSSILDVKNIAWVDEGNRIHTTDECDRFRGNWRLMSLEQAVDAGYEACESCGANRYVAHIFPAPTPTPEPERVSPATALKPAGEALVYYYDVSKGYHLSPNCQDMRNAPAHTLTEAVESGKNACRHCNPPAASLVNQAALWLDANGICHTSDECAAFVGQYRLVSRDAALEQGLPACPDCGAAEYLVPGTVLAEP